MAGIGAVADRTLLARGLRKSFGKLTAVDGIDLELRRGTCLALLGPNGAGKTTTVEMLEGLLKPDAGTIELFGLALASHRRDVLECIGVTLQETQLYKRYTVRETIELFAGFYRKALPVAEIIERMALADKADVQLRKLSGGQKQRTYLACGLVNDPELLFLDEPTTGLDPQARRATWDLLANLRREGKSLLLTTHYMEEAEVLADQVAIVDKGRIIAEGTPKELIRRTCGGEVLTAALAAPTALADLAAKLPWLGAAKALDEGFEVALDDAPARIRELFAVAAGLGTTVKTLAMRAGTLEDVFLALTGRRMRDA